MDRLKAYYPEQAVLDLLSEPDGRHGRRLRAALADTYGIRIREYSDRYVLNYSQIGSARHSFEPVVRVCRQLIVRRDLSGILHRSFDRFYNYREDPDSDAFDAAKAVCEAKLNGSLVGVYHDGTAWRHCTRSLAYAEGTMDACLEYRSFGELLDSEVDLSPVYEQGDPALSYLFELVSRFDPHVSKASGPRLYLLAARNKRSGEYADADAEARRIGWPWRPKTYAFGSLQELLESVRALPASEEGYVCRIGDWRLKLKSPAFLAGCRLKEQTRSVGSVIQMVHLCEEPEYLSCFPEDRELFSPWIALRDGMEDWFERAYAGLWASSRVQFAASLRVAGLPPPVQAVLFKMHGCGGRFREAMAAMPLQGAYAVKLYQSLQAVQGAGYPLAQAGGRSSGLARPGPDQPAAGALPPGEASLP